MKAELAPTVPPQGEQGKVIEAVDPAAAANIGAVATGEIPQFIDPTDAEGPVMQAAPPEHKSKKLVEAYAAQTQASEGSRIGGPRRLAIHPRHVRQLKKDPGHFFSGKNRDGTRKDRIGRRRAREARQDNKWNWHGMYSGSPRGGDKKKWDRRGNQRTDRAYKELQARRQAEAAAIEAK